MTGAIGGLNWRDPALAARALTHRSFGPENYERLEFLGDALVNVIIAELLYERFPKADEGDLSRVRASLINEAALAERARTLRLGEQLRLGGGEAKSGGHRRASILADAFEALIGALYLDQGFETTRQFVRAQFDAAVGAIRDLEVYKDAKTRLQEWLQGRRLPLPRYELIATRGEEHERIFTIRCQVDEPRLERSGEGRSRRAAEQAAAQAVLEALPKR